MTTAYYKYNTLTRILTTEHRYIRTADGDYDYQCNLIVRTSNGGHKYLDYSFSHLREEAA